jgi:hypothetical protein
MALINARLDAQATWNTALRHRDALRDALFSTNLMFSFPLHPHTHISIPKSRSHHRLASHTSSSAPLARHHHNSATHGFQVANHRFLLTHQPPSPIVEATVAVGAVVPPLIQWSSAELSARPPGLTRSPLTSP